VILGADVGDDEAPDASGGGHAGRVDHRGVAALVGLARELGAVGALVDQQVGAAGELLGSRRRPSVGDVGDDASASRGPEDRGGLDDAAVLEGDGLAALELAVEGAGGHAEGLGGVEVEAPGLVVLDEAVAPGLDAVVESVGLDAEVVAEVDRAWALDLAQLDVEAGSADAEAAQRAKVLAQSVRAGDDHGAVVLVQAEGGEEAGQAVDVVAVEVGDAGELEPAGPHPGARELELGTLTAVEEDEHSVEHEGDGGDVAGRGRLAARGPEKDDTELAQGYLVRQSVRAGGRGYGPARVCRAGPGRVGGTGAATARAVRWSAGASRDGR
jgi:hypothetical protein